MFTKPLIRGRGPISTLRHCVFLAPAFHMLGLGSLLAATSCGSAGAFVWADEAPATYFQAPPVLLIRPGDTLSVRVFGQEPLSERMKVRSDGLIAMPLIGSVLVAGKDTETVAKEIEQRLQPFVTAANVVVVEEESNVRVVAIGEVGHMGTIVLENNDARLLTAIAIAGGLTQFASESRIFVLRTEAHGFYRIRFQYDDIIRGVGRAASFRLRDGDQIVVE